MSYRPPKQMKDGALELNQALLDQSLKRSSQRDRDICLTVLKNRRKSKYGPWDGNPLSYEDLKELIPDLKVKELDMLTNLFCEKKVRRNRGNYE